MRYNVLSWFKEDTERCKDRPGTKIGFPKFSFRRVVIEGEVFVGHGMMFTNDQYPGLTTDNRPPTSVDRTIETPTRHCGASVGSGVGVMCGIALDRKALVGSGVVVTLDVPNMAALVGMPVWSSQHHEYESET